MRELCLIKRECCYLTLEVTALCHWQTLTSGKINHSLLRRRSQLGRHPSSLLCIWLQGFGFKEGKLCPDETFTAALERFYCSACTLCIYTWHARQTPSFRAGTWADKRREWTLHNTQVWFHCFYRTLSSKFALGTESSRLTTLSSHCSTVFWFQHRHQRLMEVFRRHVAEYFQPWVKVWECCATRTCVWSFYFPVRWVKIGWIQIQMKQSQFSTSRHMESNFIIIFMGETFLRMFTPAEKASLALTPSHS